MITFEKPFFLLCILCIGPACAITLYRIQKLKENYAAAGNIQTIIRTLRIRTTLWSIGWLFFSLAAAVPLWGTKQTTVAKHGNAVIFAVDISRSMTVTDVAPNRLEFAKRYVAFLIERLPETACGLVTIKGQGTLAVPLSFNHQSILTATETLSPFNATSAGSNLEHGLRIALEAFPENRLTGKTVVLCTDGGETTGSVQRMLTRYRQENVQLIIVGFGTETGGTLSIRNEKHESVLQKSVLEENALKRSAAQVLNGSFYISAADLGSAQKVLQSLTEGDAETEKIRYVQKPVRRTFECTAAALLFFCAGLLIGCVHVKKD
jgi:hypothetical protein